MLRASVKLIIVFRAAHGSQGYPTMKKCTHLPQLGQVDFQRLRVVLKPERDHGVEDVLSANGLPLLHLTLLRRLGRDERDELGHALLHALLRLLRDLRRRGDR